ncbi:MAG: hypothetical protein J6B77_08275 [Clostridia bacterium]|nr:hypothetical protein [Clostridia bacterium]
MSAIYTKNFTRAVISAGKSAKHPRVYYNVVFSILGVFLIICFLYAFWCNIAPFYQNTVQTTYRALEDRELITAHGAYPLPKERETACDLLQMLKPEESVSVTVSTWMQEVLEVRNSRRVLFQKEGFRASSDPILLICWVAMFVLVVFPSFVFLFVTVNSRSARKFIKREQEALGIYEKSK